MSTAGTLGYAGGMFPVSIEGTIPIGEIDAEEAEQRLARWQAWLHKSSARDIRREGDAVTFRAGMFRFVSNWNPLVAVSSGRVELRRASGTVRYELSCRQMLVVSALMVGVLAASALRSGRPPFALVPLMWLWLFGMNYLVASRRISNALRETLGPAVGPEPRPPTRF